jgi:hypothetical protein
LLEATTSNQQILELDVGTENVDDAMSSFEDYDVSPSDFITKDTDKSDHG